ncbi:hypothetical protein M0654_03780 [Rhizobium sp. NTR19]|uniref:Uncharacterized protein n=1 Tax=Neorhizobium turbinariae TaxID=2937795 RepID=A0ABT0IMJ1_9HYPH|nr:hypothetical protein [Neorhizobium turbinariae]MCK8779100.1 hypothetical protein [Neorhizobium turbinariae]
MSLFDLIKLAVGALIGFGLCMLLYVPAAVSDAREAEAARLTAATNTAIGELTNEADRARVNRRLCVERGGVYIHQTGQCGERPAAIHG